MVKFWSFDGQLHYLFSICLTWLRPTYPWPNSTHYQPN